MTKSRTHRAHSTAPITATRSKLGVVVTPDLLQSLRAAFAPEIEREHEGIAYLLGLTTGAVTVVVTAIKPDAITTFGSFKVSAPTMGRVVRVAADCGLHVVGQVHTHPDLAFHSDGDVEGARIAYSGYVSIVLPRYGSALPSLVGAAAFIYQKGDGFVELSESQLTVVAGALS